MTRPAYGRPDVAVTLTATLTKGAATETKTFAARVKAKPRAEDPERYFLGHFTGEGTADGEQLRFSISTGNNALDWVGLAGGRPSLVSQLGDQGLRDPFIIRSPDGDTFYMIATDLNWFNRNRDYQINDSQYIEVFESHDLVNWSPQRHVKVAPDNAGNAFAPEAYWDDSIGAYVVFWAQAMWRDPVTRTNPGNQQMWFATTRDFRTFSPPAVWQDPYPQSRIDTTVIKVGDWFYRFTKNEAGNAGSDVFSEKHTQLRDTNLANWTPVAPAVGRSTWVANQGYEGPLVFKANPGDTACPEQFYFWADRYTNGGGYQTSCSADIEAPAWTPKTPRFTNTGTVRHGTVTPLTLREWNRILGQPNADVATTTELSLPSPTVPEGEAFIATAKVRAADGYEAGGQVRFSAPGWQETVYLDGGIASVTVPGRVGAGMQVDHRGVRRARVPDGLDGRRLDHGHAGRGGPHRRHGAGHLGADAGRSGVVRSVHAGGGARVHRLHDGHGHLDHERRGAERVGGDVDQRRVPARAARVGGAGEDRVDRAGEQRHVRGRVQADDRAHGGAAHRRLQRERHLHAVHDPALEAAVTVPRSARPAGGGARSRRRPSRSSRCAAVDVRLGPPPRSSVTGESCWPSTSTAQGLQRRARTAPRADVRRDASHATPSPHSCLPLGGDGRNRRVAGLTTARRIGLLFWMRILLGVVAGLLLVPASASAQRVEDAFFNSVIPSRVDHLIGFTPTTFAIHPRDQRVVPIKVRVGGRTHRYIFSNAAAVVGPSATIYLRNMIRGRRFPSPQGIFLDRQLTAAERRHVKVRVDLGRDADVLAVHRGHPACAVGRHPRRRARYRRGQDPHVVSGRRSDPGNWRRDRAAARGHRDRAVGGAALRRRLAVARRGRRGG